jgi:hypothetical protein
MLAQRFCGANRERSVALEKSFLFTREGSRVGNV